MKEEEAGKDARPSGIAKNGIFAMSLENGPGLYFFGIWLIL